MHKSKVNKPNNNRNRRPESEHYSNIFDNNINFAERVIYMNSDVDEFALDLILKAFDEFEKGENPTPVRIEISSYGGSVYDMLAIVGRIRSSSCHVITRGFGKIMSAATLILASGDERFMDQNSWLMIHELSDRIRGKLGDMEVDMRHNKQLQKQMYELYEKFSKGRAKAETFKKLCTGKDQYLDPKAATKLGIVDKIL